MTKPEILAQIKIASTIIEHDLPWEYQGTEGKWTGRVTTRYSPLTCIVNNVNIRIFRPELKLPAGDSWTFPPDSPQLPWDKRPLTKNEQRFYRRNPKARPEVLSMRHLDLSSPVPNDNPSFDKTYFYAVDRNLPIPVQITKTLLWDAEKGCFHAE